jgi:hypothetical protein
VSLFPLKFSTNETLTSLGIKSRILKNEPIRLQEITKECINAPLPLTAGEPPMQFAIKSQRPGFVDTFLKHPHFDIDTKNGSGFTAPQVVGRFLEQLHIVKQIRTLIDQLPQPVKNLIKTQANATPPQAENDLLNHGGLSPQLKAHFQEKYPDNIYFQKASSGDVLDPDLLPHNALQRITQLEQGYEQIRKSIQEYGNKRNITILWD